MLRRMSVHAADLSEPRERYVWTDLAARTFESGVVFCRYEPAHETEDGDAA